MTDEVSGFDFASHEKSAVTDYLKVQGFYGDLAGVIGGVIKECVATRQIKVHSVNHRAKSADSFGRKAVVPSEQNPELPKYPEPLKQITDLAGVRVITYFPATLAQIDSLLRDEFEIVERSDKGEELLEDDRFGYHSIHYLLRLKEPRSRLAEYTRFVSAITEVQVRTILQHAWAEIEHDIQYKSATTIPSEIRRRFIALAGVLEIADREFQGIQDADKRLTLDARTSINQGNLQGVEITPDALKQFLDRRLGSDGRISEWSYNWEARMLKLLGFRDLRQVEKAISTYNDDILSSIAWKSRQGQTTRFELMLLAALGDKFFEKHMWRNEAWFVSRSRNQLDAFRASNIPIGIYDPLDESRASQE
jgi:putative GTP pyrophosphokinase